VTQLGGQALVVVILTCVWTGMTVLARGHAKVSLRVQRGALALCVAVTAAVLAWSVWSRPQPKASDLAPIWASARALLHHQDPYEAVGPGRAFDTDFRRSIP
jgi:hypothetical protein